MFPSIKIYNIDIRNVYEHKPNERLSRHLVAHDLEFWQKIKSDHDIRLEKATIFESQRE